MTEIRQKCGFVALLGAPNAGKSTLLNTIVGAKVSIVTPKVQTTRTRILGVSLAGAAQLVFIDTPGIFKPAPGPRDGGGCVGRGIRFRCHSSAD